MINKEARKTEVTTRAHPVAVTVEEEDWLAVSGAGSFKFLG